MKNIRLFQTYSVRWRSTAAAAHSPVVSTGSPEDIDVTNELLTAKPYSQVPGPTPWPIIGNTWRMLPIIGSVRIIRNLILSEKMFKLKMSVFFSKAHIKYQIWQMFLTFYTNNTEKWPSWETSLVDRTCCLFMMPMK